MYRLLWILYLSLVSCSSVHAPEFKNAEQKKKSAEFIDFLKLKEGSRLSAEELSGIQFLHDGNFKEASASFNKAVKSYPQASNPHFLNALAYHLMAKAGETRQVDLAVVGYDLAIKYNPSHCYAHYFRGILHFEKGEFAQAQQDFAQALLLQPKDSKIAHGLAVSAYYNHDLEMAAGAAVQALQMLPDNKEYLQTAAMIMASSGRDKESSQYVERLQKISTQDPEDRRRLEFIKQRLKEWQAIYKDALEKPKVQLAGFGDLPAPAAFGGMGTGTASSMAGGFGGSSFSAGGTMGGLPPLGAARGAAPAIHAMDDRMVVVDVVLIMTKESTTETIGLNLLDQLSMTFQGGALFGKNTGLVPSYNIGNSTTSFPTATSNLAGKYQQVVGQITIPAVTYSLAVADSQGTKSEILARPSLLARHGQTSQFFTGDNLTFGYGNGTAVSIQTQEVGVALGVTPQILENGQVNLKVNLNRRYFVALDPLLPAGTSGYQTAGTTLYSDVIMNFGDTLILGGLSDKLRTSQESGTLGLKDIPILGFFFGQTIDTTEYSSVIILVTPRLPQYVYQTPESLAQQKGGKQKTSPVTELKGRYGDWFFPYGNLTAVFSQLQSNGLYKEFRTGDVNLQQWAQPDEYMGNIKTSMDSVF